MCSGRWNNIKRNKEIKILTNVVVGQPFLLLFYWSCDDPVFSRLSLGWFSIKQKELYVNINILVYRQIILSIYEARQYDTVCSPIVDLKSSLIIYAFINYMKGQSSFIIYAFINYMKGHVMTSTKYTLKLWLMT